MGFTGIFKHVLDPKNRIFIPSEFREGLGDSFFIFKSHENCIVLYDAERWEKFIEETCRDTSSSVSRMKRRVCFSRVASCKMDKQGRITIGSDFLENAAIEKEVVIAGMGNCIEIWNPTAWKQIEEINEEELFEGISL